MGWKFQEPNRLKIILNGSYGLMLLGLVTMGIGILSLIIFFATSHDDLYVYDVKVYFGYGFLSFGSSCFLLGFICYYTHKKQAEENVECLYVSLYICEIICVFQFLVQLLGVCGIAAAIIGMNAAHADGDEMACRRTDFMRQSHRLYKKSEEILCHTECPCFISETYKYDSGFISGLTIQQQQSSPLQNTINVMNCPQYDDMIQRIGWEGDTNMTNFITSLELAFDCAGICAQSPMYMFSDVNRGPPQSQGSCFDELVSFTDKWGYATLILCFALTLGVILLLIASCQYCLCCKRDSNNGYSNPPDQQNPQNQPPQQSNLQQQQQTPNYQHQQYAPNAYQQQLNQGYQQSNQYQYNNQQNLNYPNYQYQYKGPNNYNQNPPNQFNSNSNTNYQQPPNNNISNQQQYNNQPYYPNQQQQPYQQQNPSYNPNPQTNNNINNNNQQIQSNQSEIQYQQNLLTPVNNNTNIYNNQQAATNQDIQKQQQQ